MMRKAEGSENVMWHTFAHRSQLQANDKKFVDLCGDTPKRDVARFRQFSQ
jgi:hypothetical protein